MLAPVTAFACSCQVHLTGLHGSGFYIPILFSLIFFRLKSIGRFRRQICSL